MPSILTIIKILILLLGISNQAFGQIGQIEEVQILKEEYGKKYIASQLFKNSNAQFKPFKFEDVTNVERSFWIKFKYQNTQFQEHYYLNYPPLIFKKIDLYYQLNNQTIHRQSGFSVPFKHKNIYSPNLYLELPNHIEPVTCLLHVNSFNGYFFFFSQQNSTNVFRSEVTDLHVEYFVIGMCCFTVLFSFVFFLFLKEKLYLYYALFASMMVISRLTYSGNIFLYIINYYDFSSIKSIMNLFTISYELINIFLILYFHEFLKFNQKSKWYLKTIQAIVSLKVIFLVIHLISQNQIIINLVDNHWIDLMIQLFFVAIALDTVRKYRKPNMFAIASLLILIVGNLIYILPSIGIANFNSDSYYLFINIEVFEIAVFAISIGYRNNFLKKERDNAMIAIMDNLKKNEELKDNINKELEIKVVERTEQIEKMNQLLKFHNIKLKSEVKVANEARVFQKNMNYEEFIKIFQDDKSCYNYLAKLKWKEATVLCKKCGYDKLTELENHAFRCGKCSWVESVTNGTLFHKVRFPIQKAFYITYLTSIGTKEANKVTDISKEIDLRNATVWAFRQKVLTLMEENKSKKKHKDGWTHLIEYSIKI